MSILFITPLARTAIDASQEHAKEKKIRFRARVAYDGTRYSGWQFQKEAPTIQAELEKAIFRRVGKYVRVVGASRTDSGVHARGQGVHFDVPLSSLTRCRDPKQLQFTVNQMLPRDIRITRIGKAPVSPVSEDEVVGDCVNAHMPKQMRPWHSIYCSTGKLYTYRFCTGEVLDPMHRLYRHHEWRAARYDFSDEVLRQAASKFVGTHDFSAFTNTAQAPNGIDSPVLKNPYRHVRSADVIGEGDGLYRIEFRIDGALYRMIRNIMGTILHVACGKLELSAIDHMFRSKDRRLVPKSAPANGLCLEEVFYDNWKLQC